MPSPTGGSNRWMWPSVVVSFALLIGESAAVSVTGAESLTEETAAVVIQRRQFTPPRTILHQGRPTRLVFQNRDTELHSFAPDGLFAGASFNVSGNGAPEFGPEGLKRVIIPPDGVAEIRFTPRTPGEFRYMCDMPGHQMNGVIAVE